MLELLIIPFRRSTSESENAVWNGIGLAHSWMEICICLIAPRHDGRRFPREPSITYLRCQDGSDPVRGFIITPQDPKLFPLPRTYLIVTCRRCLKNAQPDGHSTNWQILYMYTRTCFQLYFLTSGYTAYFGRIVCKKFFTIVVIMVTF